MASLRGVPGSRASHTLLHHSVLRLFRVALAITVVVVCTLFPLQAAAQPDALAGKIESILETSPAGRGFWGIEVVGRFPGIALPATAHTQLPYLWMAFSVQEAWRLLARLEPKKSTLRRTLPEVSH